MASGLESSPFWGVGAPRCGERQVGLKPVSSPQPLPGGASETVGKRPGDQAGPPRQTVPPFRTPGSLPPCLSLAKGPLTAEKTLKIHNCRHLVSETEGRGAQSRPPWDPAVPSPSLVRVCPGAPTSGNSCLWLWEGGARVPVALAPPATCPVKALRASLASPTALGTREVPCLRPDGSKDPSPLLREAGFPPSLPCGPPPSPQGGCWSASQCFPWALQATVPGTHCPARAQGPCPPHPTPRIRRRASFPGELGEGLCARGPMLGAGWGWRPSWPSAGPKLSQGRGPAALSQDPQHLSDECFLRCPLHAGLWAHKLAGPCLWA